MRSATPTTSRTVTSPDGTTIAYQEAGSGDGVIVVGGALRAACDYLPFAEVLARSFTVYVMERRGRGASGPQGRAYSIEKECEDLLAVQAETDARAAFGHSYGGLVCLETARRTAAFRQLAVYEPGAWMEGVFSAAWMPQYRKRLDQGDTRGAFACMVKGAGFAPAVVAKMPLWYVKLVLRLAIPKRRWTPMEALLGANLAEHEEVGRLAGNLDRFRSIGSRVLLLGGGKSPPAIVRRSLGALHEIIAGSSMEIIDGLAHTAPDEDAPGIVGERVLAYFRATTGEEYVRSQHTVVMNSRPEESR